MGLSAAHDNINKYVNDHLDEVKARSGAEHLAAKPLIWRWLGNWSEDAYKSWADNPTIDYL